MSLIYDYLKINGKGEAGKNSRIEIPPALLKGDYESPARSSKQPFLVFLGSCFVIGIILLSIYKISSTRQELKLSAGQESTASITEAVLTSETPVPPAEHEPVEQAAAGYKSSLPPSVDINQSFQTATQEIVQVFPEPEVHKPSAVTQEMDGRMSQKVETSASADLPAAMESAKPVESPVRQPSPQSVSRVRVYDSAKLKVATPAKGEKYYQAGLQAQQGGDLRTAEIFYKKAFADSPDHLNSMINLSAIYVQQERYRDAEEILWVILGVDKSNSKALVNLGVINLYQGRNVKAEGYFLKALQANPREENGLVNLAYLAEQKKDYAAAEMYYKQILQITPDNLEVLLAYAYMLEQQYRYPEALVVYKDSLDLDAMRNNKELFARVLERRNQLARDVRDSRQ
jgi:Tfp pilus assembly protein PilF